MSFVTSALGGAKRGFEIMSPIVQSIMILALIIIQITVMSTNISQVINTLNPASYVVDNAQSYLNFIGNFMAIISLLAIVLIVLSAVNMFGTDREAGILGLYRARNILVWSMVMLWYLFAYVVVYINTQNHNMAIIDIVCTFVGLFLVWPILQNLYHSIKSLKPLLDVVIKVFHRKGASA